MKKLISLFGLLLIISTTMFTSCNDGGPYAEDFVLGVDGDAFTIYKEGSAATDIKVNEDGSVEWIATAAGGGGGGVSFYMNEGKTEINIANYESIVLDIEYSPIDSKWNDSAKNPGFCMRMLTWDSTGIFGGYEDLEYFDSEAREGSLTHTIEIPANFANKVISSCDFDGLKGFALKFNDYERGNSDGDQLKVKLNRVKFIAKKKAPIDIPVPRLPESKKGTVQSIYYPTQDYTVAENAPKYEKHGWVYLPAGYDANDKDTKYPVFILLHGFGQNENTWGLSDQGNGGKIIACYNVGAINGPRNNDARVGGVLSEGFDGKVIACYNTGTLQGSPRGNIVGRVFSSAISFEISNCYWTGTDEAVGANDDNKASISGGGAVTGTDWTAAMNAMNSALESEGVEYRYELNTDEATKEAEPLKLKLK